MRIWYDGSALALEDIIEMHDHWARSGGRRGERADLSHADLRGWHLSGVDLRWADLTKADLRGVDLSRTLLAGARLVNADLEGATLPPGYTVLHESLTGLLRLPEGRLDIEDECHSLRDWRENFTEYADELGMTEDDRAWVRKILDEVMP